MIDQTFSQALDLSVTQIKGYIPKLEAIDIL